MNTHQQTDRGYLHTYSAGAWLPFMQASLTAAIVTLAAWALVWMIFDPVDPHKPALMLGILVWVWQWIKLQGHWFALTAVENVMRMDINGDGVIGSTDQDEAEDEARVIRIQLIKEDGHISETVDLPCDDDQLSTLAKGLINDLPFSEKFWTGRGKPFSTNQFRTLRDAMMKRGLCEYVNARDPRQGIRLTEEGRGVMQHFALPHSPTEREEA